MKTVASLIRHRVAVDAQSLADEHVDLRRLAEIGAR